MNQINGKWVNIVSIKISNRVEISFGFSFKNALQLNYRHVKCQFHTEKNNKKLSRRHTNPFRFFMPLFFKANHVFFFLLISSACFLFCAFTRYKCSVGGHFFTDTQLHTQFIACLFLLRHSLKYWILHFGMLSIEQSLDKACVFMAVFLFFEWFANVFLHKFATITNIEINKMFGAIGIYRLVDYIFCLFILSCFDSDARIANRQTDNWV